MKESKAAIIAQALARKAIGLMAYPVFILIYLLPKRLRPTITKINCERIGHFAGDFLIALQEQNHSTCQQPAWHYINTRSGCCNSYLAKLAIRHLKGKHLAEAYFSGADRLPVTKHLKKDSPYDRSGSRDITGLTQLGTVPNLFTKQEDIIGSTWLAAHGYETSMKLVLVLNRDSLYLSRIYPGQNVEHHAPRNTPIEVFEKTIRWLVNDHEDIFVIRMGKVAAEECNVKSERFIDYPFCNESSDFLDIWLFSKCDFFLSTGSGPDIIPMYLQIPGVLADFIPLAHVPSYGRVFAAPKKIRKAKDRQLLTPAGVLRVKSSDAGYLSSSGLEAISLTPTEVLETTKMAWDFFIEKNRYQTYINRAGEQIYTDELKESYPTLHGYNNPEFRLVFW